jgi:hypothetical protein
LYNSVSYLLLETAGHTTNELFSRLYPATFNNDDPCVNVLKHFSSEVSCTVPACTSHNMENEVGTIQCPAGTTVQKILFADYGTSTGDCEGAAFQRGSCSKDVSGTQALDNCLGKNQCQITYVDLPSLFFFKIFLYIFCFF